MTFFINICEVRSAFVLLAPLFLFACVVGYLPYGFLSLSLSHSLLLNLFSTCRGDIVARELCRMPSVLHSTSLYPFREAGVALCL